jgi:hypothetical protein
VEASLKGGGYRLVDVAIGDERVVPRAGSLNSVVAWGSLFSQMHTAALLRVPLVPAKGNWTGTDRVFYVTATLERSNSRRAERLVSYRGPLA